MLRDSLYPVQMILRYVPKYFMLIPVMVLAGCNQNSHQVFDLLGSDQSGIDFSNTLTSTDDQNILDYLYFYNGGGVAIGDLNGDELPDVYFTSNQGSNRLYINKGDLKFEDVTERAGVGGTSDWNTGVAMADVNGDGLLDMYVCAVVGIHGFEGVNELFINNGDGTFTDRAAVYGLNKKGFSTAAYFFDYDLDGDLDLYLLNHAIHTPNTFGKANIRYERNENSGDKLFRNEGSGFVDVSEAAGIFGGDNSYGLSASISDFNSDGYPDIYVCNDFYEDDYYYINNGDGTFQEALKEYFGHVSQFSMGSDAGDINGDGYPDLMTLDMLPYDERVLKMSGGDLSPQNQKTRIEQMGYHYQFSRNMLQINNPSNYFSEQALMSGVASTDWSWSILFGDYDQDGKQDIFVSNGIPRRPNDLDYINFISDARIEKMMNTSNAIDEKVLSYMPDGTLPNFFFQGGDNLHFSDKSDVWCNQNPDYSNGAAYGDLDNDGDLDLVTNNINAPASIYINNTNASSHYLKLRFQYGVNNGLGIGTKAYIYVNGKAQFKELFSQRGFQSSSEPVLHFGLGQSTIVDSIRIIWPDQSLKAIKKVDADQTLLVKYEGSNDKNRESFQTQYSFRFDEISESLGLDFVHKENNYIDFNHQALAPFQSTDRGPAMAVGDLNGDGRDDIYFGNAHGNQGAVYLQAEKGFEEVSYPFLEATRKFEDASAAIADFDTDGIAELLVGSGGGQATGKVLENRLYQSGSKDYLIEDWFKHQDNTSVIRVYDFDNDGDQDVFVGNSSVSNDYGKVSPSYLILNKDGKMEVLTQFDSLGIVTDAVWTDFNNDGQTDLIVVGEWMAPSFLEHNNGEFKDQTASYLNSPLNGLWRSVFPFDIDGDGDVDYLLGNWGLNSKLRASKGLPLQMYYNDFDNNGKSETLVAFERNGRYYALEGLDMLGKQLVSLKKKFTSYGQFAGKTFDEIFNETSLAEANLYEVYTLASGVLLKTDQGFIFEAFKSELQVSPINSFTRVQNARGKEVVVCAGNYFGISPYHGRFDGFSGAVLNGEEVTPGYLAGFDFFNKSVTQLQTVDVGGKQILLAVINDGKVQAYQIKE